MKKYKGLIQDLFRLANAKFGGSLTLALLRFNGFPAFLKAVRAVANLHFRAKLKDTLKALVKRFLV